MSRTNKAVLVRETRVVLPACPAAEQRAVVWDGDRTPVDTLEPERHDHEYDLVVLGGGSGGLACAKAASALGASVACVDFVTPSPQGTTWGLGGTCVNVGCIPKKLMHHAAQVGSDLRRAAAAYGWLPADELADDPEHDWAALVANVTDYIRSLNFGYRSDLSAQGVRYYNALGKFVGPHRLELAAKDGVRSTITARRFVVAVGGRPVYPDGVPGAREHGITSDDLFRLPRDPGRTLCVGGGYVALECAGFLAGLGREVHVAYRSVPLRGFDRQMADLVVGHMAADTGVRFHAGAVPVAVKPTPGKRLRVELQGPGGRFSEEFDTVLFAVGRRADTASLGLETVGVVVDEAGKIKTDAMDRTTCPYIYAIGDVAQVTRY